MNSLKVVGVIPAHMASVRFPGKILHPFFGYPMIEHVRRRAMLSAKLDDVFVATCDEVIAKIVRDYGGKVLMTGNYHLNGTTRVAEAVQEIDCSHVILLQGDEPLLLPSYIDRVVDAISKNPESDAWNATGPVESQEDIDRHSFVKCAVSSDNRILYCFRRGPSHANFINQERYIRKILGIIAYRKSFIKDLVKLPISNIESFELIEQMRVIENGFLLNSVAFSDSLPSVNQPDEADVVIEYLSKNELQRELLATTFGVRDT